jgi:hypothetical protein
LPASGSLRRLARDGRRHALRAGALFDHLPMFLLHSLPIGIGSGTGDLLLIARALLRGHEFGTPDALCLDGAGEGDHAEDGPRDRAHRAMLTVVHGRVSS